jgi:hypothetical protein
MNTKILCEETPLRIWLWISSNATTQREHNAKTMMLSKRYAKVAPTIIMVAPAYHPRLFSEEALAAPSAAWVSRELPGSLPRKQGNDSYEH